MKMRQTADSCFRLIGLHQLFRAGWPSISAMYASSCNVKYAQIHENLRES